MPLGQMSETLYVGNVQILTARETRPKRREPQHTVRTCYSEDGAVESSYTTRFFQRPRRKTMALTTANVENAMVIATNTPFGPRFNQTPST